MSVQKKSARASILDAAATAFAKYGVDQTSIEDISRTMNASNPAEIDVMKSTIIALARAAKASAKEAEK